MAEDKDRIKRAREVQIQVRGAEILDQALKELHAMEPDAQVRVDSLLTGILLSQIKVQQEEILKELRNIDHHLDTGVRTMN